MSDLTFIEKTKLEKLFHMGGGSWTSLEISHHRPRSPPAFHMGGGYVLDFSNRTLAEFVAESTGRDIYDAKYDYASAPANSGDTIHNS